MRFCYRGEHHTALEREYFETWYSVDDHLAGLRQLRDGQIAHVPETFLGQDLAKSVMYNEAMPRSNGSSLERFHSEARGARWWCDAHARLRRWQCT